MKVIALAVAMAELQEAFEYYESQSPGLGHRF